MFESLSKNNLPNKIYLVASHMSFHIEFAFFSQEMFLIANTPFLFHSSSTFIVDRPLLLFFNLFFTTLAKALLLFQTCECGLSRMFCCCKTILARSNSLILFHLSAVLHIQFSSLFSVILCSKGGMCGLIKSTDEGSAFPHAVP